MQEDDVPRPLETEDAPAVHALFSRPDVAPWTGCTPFDPIAVWSHRLASEGDRLGLWRGEELVAAALLGRKQHVRGAHTAALTWAHRPEAPPEALRAILDAADRWLGLLRVEADVDVDDPGRGALEEAGFRVEGVRRQARWRQGALRDVAFLGRIRPGWEPPSGTPPGPPPWPARTGRAEGALVIRPSVPQDAPLFAEAARDETVMWGTQQIPTVTAGAWASRLASNDHIGRHGLVAEIAGRPVGTMSVFLQDHPSRHVAQLGMMVLAAAQGQGVGDRMVAAAVELAEHWLGATRFELEVYPDNLRARGLYEKHGFVAEGARRCATFRDGHYVDSLVMARVSRGR
jgi:putative acetyltransferase